MLTVLFNFKYQWSIIFVLVECFITGFVRRVTRPVTLVEQEQLTVPEHLCSRQVISGFLVTRSLVICVCFVDGCFCPFVVFHSDFLLSVLLRYTDFYYPFGIFKFFLALVVSSLYNSVIPWLYQLTFLTPCWWAIVHIPVFVGLSSCYFIIFTVFILDFRTVLRGYQRSYQKP
jgi:hypothetical protein